MQDLKCPHCQSGNKKKDGFMKTKRGKTQVYKCKDCKKKFSKRNESINYRHRKQHLRERIRKMYCERMSLRGIARTLGVNYKTVVRYFRELAAEAHKANKKRIAEGGFVTSFVQFDQLETYEHTRRKPVGIQVSVRCKTKEIISARVGYIPIRALTVSKAYSREWNSKITDSRTKEMLIRTKAVLNKKGALISCDRENRQVNLLKQLCTEPHITLAPSPAENKVIDRVFRRMRQDISRLGRKTLSTTKDISELQKHLDLYTDYHNMKRAA